MYAHDWRKALRELIEKKISKKAFKALSCDDFLDVELGLCALEQLGLSDEPPMSLWALATGLPLPDERLAAVQADPHKRSVLGNLRVMLRHSGREHWENILSQYAQLDASQRSYAFEAFDQGGFTPTNHFPTLQSAYQSALKTQLAHRESERKPLMQESEVSFVMSSDREQLVTVKLPAQLIETAKNTPISPLPPKRSVPQTWHVTWDELRRVAAWLDEREGNVNHWQERLKKIHFRTYQDGQLSAANAETLVLDGVKHLAGMVGSGKSTLMQLLAVLGWQQKRRIALVVADTMTALNLADQFNRALGEIAAVAITGRSRRGRYLQQLHLTYGEDALKHGAMRWFDTTCLIYGLAEIEQYPSPLETGNEPCRYLLEGNKAHLCPLFAICPSQRLYHDLPRALIWITTPGAMGAAKLPEQLDPRHPVLGEVIYEQCDLVIFDEVETIQTWFDQLHAPELRLVGAHKGDGFFNLADRAISDNVTGKRLQGDEERRWKQASNHASALATRLLNMLNEHKWLSDELGQGYFTAAQLFGSLARQRTRLEALEPDSNEYQKARQHTEALITDFETVRNMPFVRSLQSSPRSAEEQLIDVARVFLEDGMSRSDDVEKLCQEWLRAYLFADEGEIAAFDDEAGALTKRTKREWDTFERLALRLEAALNVMVLEQQMRIVFNQWYSSPDDLPNELQSYMLYRVPQHLRGLMPVPATGRLFGFRYQAAEGNNNPTLSAFDYAHIGRHYVLTFSTLRQATEKQAGAHVLMLSGTSWLPDSREFHVDIEPFGVLVPNPESCAALSQSTFTFEPIVDKRQQPIRVSGAGSNKAMLENLTKIADGLIPRLHKKLEELKAKDSEAAWRDRARLLLFVNSYEQAAQVAERLGRSIEGVRALTRNSDETVWEDSGVRRGEVETFARREDRILVAPLAALGRAYNVLNQYGKAAFGAVYFLTRPMPLPSDLLRLVQAANAQALEWCRGSSSDLTQAETLYAKMKALRSQASSYWRGLEWQDASFRHLPDKARCDLAARTAGLLIQACGRLLRGDVPFHAILVDAAWLPETAKGGTDTKETSLFLAVLERLFEYSSKPLGNSLYANLHDVLRAIRYKDRPLFA